MKKKAFWPFIVVLSIGVASALIYARIVGFTAAIAPPASLQPFFAAQTSLALFLWDFLVVRLPASLIAAIPCAVILVRLLRRRKVLFAWLATVPLLVALQSHLWLPPYTGVYLELWVEAPWHFLPPLINMGWLPLLVYILNRSTTLNIPLEGDGEAAPQIGR